VAVIEAFELRGGSHDGERHRPSAPPQTLFGITTDDGERFARTGERVRDAGVLWTVFGLTPTA
jgi:hypothetical protein